MWSLNSDQISVRYHGHRLQPWTTQFPGQERCWVDFWNLTTQPTTTFGGTDKMLFQILHQGITFSSLNRNYGLLKKPSEFEVRQAVWASNWFLGTNLFLIVSDNDNITWFFSICWDNNHRRHSFGVILSYLRLRVKIFNRGRQQKHSCQLNRVCF